jgi:hypothetical protein
VDVVKAVKRSRVYCMYRCYLADTCPEEMRRIAASLSYGPAGQSPANRSVEAASSTRVTCPDQIQIRSDQLPHAPLRAGTLDG